MAKYKISDLPPAPYKTVASEAERRGIAATQGIISDANSVILIGAIDMIRELIERIEILEAGYENRNRQTSKTK